MTKFKDGPVGVKGKGGEWESEWEGVISVFEWLLTECFTSLRVETSG